MRAQHHGKGSDRFRMIAPERVAQRGLSIPARRVLDEDSEAGERPQEPRHRRAMRMRGICQFPNALWAAGDKIGKGQLGATWIACTAIAPGHSICIICIDGETGCACGSPLLIRPS
jgi:hypothetical protein